MELAYRGLKVSDRTLKLKHLNLVIGPPAAGKTAVAQAFRILAQGSDPSIGRRPSDTAKLMRGESMDITLAFGAKAIRRGIAIKKGVFTRTASASWIDEKEKPTIHGEAIRALFGNGDEEVYQSLDIRAFFALAPSERSVEIAKLIGTDEEDPARVAEEVWSWMVQRLVYPKKTKAPKNWKEDIWPMVKEQHLPILEILSAEFPAKVAAVPIGEMIIWANEEKRQARSDIERRDAAREELRAKVMMLPETHPDEIAKMERERDGLQTDVGAWRQRKSDWEARETKAKVARADLKRSLGKIGDLQGRAEAISDQTDEIEAKRAEHIDVQDRLDKMVPPTPGDYRAAGALHEEAEALVERANAIQIPHEIDMEPFGTEVLAIQSELMEAGENPWNTVEEIAERLEEYSTDVPDSTAFIADTVQLKSLAHEHGGGNHKDAIQARLDVAELASAAAATENAKVSKRRSAAERKRRPLLEKAKAKQAEADAISAKIDLDHEDGHAAYQKEKDGLIDRRTALGDEIETFETEEQAVQEDARAGKADVDSAKSVLSALGPALPSPDTAEGEDLDSTLKGIKDSLKSLTLAVAQRNAIDEIIKEIERAKAKAEIYAAIEWALKVKRDAGVTIRAGSLMETMRNFLRSADREEVPYIRAEPGKCEIGWRTTEGDERAVEAMCGTEWCIFAGALASAVIIARDASFRILLIEADDIGGEPFLAMLRGIEAVMDGLTLVVVITQHQASVEKVGPPWHIIQMGMEVAAA